MPGIHVCHSKLWEELSDQRDDFVGHVLALRSSDEQRGLLEPYGRGVLEREVSEVVEGAG